MVIKYRQIRSISPPLQRVICNDVYAHHVCAHGRENCRHLPLQYQGSSDTRDAVAQMYWHVRVRLTAWKFGTWAHTPDFFEFGVNARPHPKFGMNVVYKGWAYTPNFTVHAAVGNFRSQLRWKMVARIKFSSEGGGGGQSLDRGGSTCTYEDQTASLLLSNTKAANQSNCNDENTVGDENNTKRQATNSGHCQIWLHLILLHLAGIAKHKRENTKY